MRANLLVLAGLSLMAAAPAAGAAQGPMDFLQGLYARYAESTDASFDSLDNRPAWYSPGLIKLIHADEVAAGGDEGKLEVDPVCDCQDYGDFKVISIVVNRQAPGTAQATVKFINLGQADTVTVSLVKLQAGWRIDDLGGTDMPSLRVLLTAPG